MRPELLAPLYDVGIIGWGKNSVGLIGKKTGEQTYLPVHVLGMVRSLGERAMRRGSAECE